MPTPSQGTKRALDISPADSSELASKRQRYDVDDENALAFTDSISQPQQGFTDETHQAESPQPQQVSNAQQTLVDEVESWFDFNPTDASAATIASSTDETFPLPFDLEV